MRGRSRSPGDAHGDDRGSSKATAWSAWLRQLLVHKGRTDAGADRTPILIEDGEISLRSTAVLKIAKRLTAPWRWAAVFLWVPRPIRDAVYRVVAAIRHRIAGQSNACEVPPPEIRSRLITP